MRVQRLVERAIEAECEDGNEIEGLSDEARERLRDEEEFGDLMSRPFGETVVLIARDLGLSPDWGALGAGRWLPDRGAVEAATFLSKDEHGESQEDAPTDPVEGRSPAAPSALPGPRGVVPADLRPGMTEDG